MSQSQKNKLREIAFKRGYKPPSQKGMKRSSVWNKGKICPQLQGKNNGHWRGNLADYTSIHNWVRRWKGIAFMCQNCGTKRTTKCSIQWANLDHKYKRVLGDYIALCVKCHRLFDKIKK